MIEFRCFKCGTTEGVLIRQNEKGVPGIFACEKHSNKSSDPVVAEVAAVIDKGLNKPTEH